MSDKGKTAAIEELRREVGFGCPVCRSPFLTWHHFDPPEHVEKHWRPEGIIALCRCCHDDADEKGKLAGAYSKEELRVMKTSGRKSDDVKGHFPTWQDKERLLVRVGGCYTDTSSPVISVNEIPQITLGKNGGGLLSLSFELRNTNDEVLVKMEDNWFTAYPPNVHDMAVTPKTKEVKVWLAKDDVGLEFSFRRITMAELDEVLSEDWKKIAPIQEKAIQAMLANLPTEQREFVKRSLQQPPSDWWLTRLERLPPEIREAHLAVDKTGSFVKHWVKRNCMMYDGLIPFLNFEQMAIYFHGERITIKDGVADFIHYCSAFENPKGAINLVCRCPKCLPQSH